MSGTLTASHDVRSQPPCWEKQLLGLPEEKGSGKGGALLDLGRGLLNSAPRGFLRPDIMAVTVQPSPTGHPCQR